MFEQPVGKVEKDRSKLIIGVSAVAVLVVILLIVLVSSLSSGSRQGVEMAVIGTPEFDAYAPYIEFEVRDKLEGERFNNSKYMRILGLVKNQGDKVLTGLQVKILAIRYTGDDESQYEIIKEKVVNPIPVLHKSLDPKRSVPVELYLEPIENRELINNILVLVNGLKVE